MTRTMNEDGTCYRAYVEYEKTKPDGQVVKSTVYFGPYAVPAIAKAQRTRWLNWCRSRILVLREGVQISDSWREI